MYHEVRRKVGAKVGTRKGNCLSRCGRNIASSMGRAVPTVLLAITLSTPVAAVGSQDESLPRRGYFGVGLEESEKGPRVFAVMPGSTAASVGIVVGDVIRAVDGKVTGKPEEVIAAIGHYRGGETATIDLLRAAGPEHLRVGLKPLPREQMTGATVHYGSVVSVHGVRLRTSLSIPSNQGSGPFPAVLLIQGGSCGSIDTPFATDIGQPGLIHAIGSQGFVTMRVEKSGVGDSSGPACEMIGFEEELAGYRAAIRDLVTHPQVDRSRVYLLGISLGGVFAPLLAGDHGFSGIITYGTLDRPPNPYPGRSAKFFEEFGGVDVHGAWKKVHTRVLVLRGEFDESASAVAQQTIAAIVNHSEGSRAEYRELAGLDHCWSRHASMDASRGNCGRGEKTTTLMDAILEFLRE